MSEDRSTLPGGPGRARQRLLVFAPNLLVAPTRSGVQRVTLELIHALIGPDFGDRTGPTGLEFVNWDPIEGQMRHFDARDLDRVFSDADWPAGLSVHPGAHRLNQRFCDTMAGCEVRVLMPEVFHFIPNGNEIHARVISQCIEYGWTTAAVFYDLIPIKNIRYQTDRDHHRYVTELLRVDRVLSISRFSEGDLLAQYGSLGVTEEMIRAAGQRLHAVPLPSTAVASDEHGRSGLSKDGAKRCIVMLGTVEPRKRQIEIVRAFQRLQIAQRSGLSLRILGSLHPLVAAEFKALLKDDPSIVYSGYSSDRDVAAAFDEALFSVFASDDEGFGLPITESLAHGVPCLTANFGAMAEAAEGGGCLTVDVRDESALGHGLAKMTFDTALNERLRGEIARRPSRTWGDYAGDVWDAIFPVSDVDSGLERAAGLIAGAMAGSKPAVTMDAGLLGGGEGGSISVHVWRDARERGVERVRGGPGMAVALVLGDAANWAGVGAGALDALGRMDAVYCASEGGYRALIAGARKHGLGRMLPGWFGVVPGEDFARGVVGMLSGAVGQVRRREVVARREANYQTASNAIGLGRAMPVLTVVISTYNRARFVAANVAWILRHLEAWGEMIELVVVDNASTDDTEERLGSYADNRLFRYVRNSSNVGMLGNLRVCSTLIGARHVWVIGDDDFLVPEALVMLMRVLTMERAAPFVFMNFGVYHRAAMTDGDTAEMFLAERQVLAGSPQPTGRYRVREAGQQHDNLFTAIYPIVFRSDILAAVFNHPFSGKPFRSLVESVPTTKAILSSYAEAPAMWLASVGIVGNAHNSWQRHRVAWHGVLTPMMLELARQAGLDARLLHEWGSVHVGLLKEAQVLFPDATVGEEFSEGDLGASYRVFREDLLGS